jgi:hypothetical protein
VTAGRRLGALLAGVLLLVVAAAWVTPSPAYACTCRASTEAEQLERASVVFIGTVVGDRAAGDTRTYTFAVDRVYRGRVLATQDLNTHVQSSACGLDLPAGGQYLVLGFLQNDVLLASSCGGTRLGGPPAELGPGYPPLSDSARTGLTWTPTNSTMTLLIGAAFLVFAVVVARRRR